MTTVLAARGLVKHFGGVRAVDGVDLKVEAGEIVALIGPNGAGKSTCFSLLMGQRRPDAGRVEILGRDVTAWPPRRIWRLGVGRTFQITAIFASFSVVQNVQLARQSWHRRTLAVFPRARRIERDSALDLLHLVGLGELADRPCATLAYGDLKRVELAMALANAPRLLLMDEPTAGTAPGERQDLMRLVARLAAERGIGILFTEHDMDVVFAHAHRLLVMSRGRLIADGHPDAVRAMPEVQDIYLGHAAA